jgi:hypothetical protein
MHSRLESWCYVVGKLQHIPTQQQQQCIGQVRSACLFTSQAKPSLHCIMVCACCNPGQSHNQVSAEFSANNSKTTKPLS